MNIFDFLSVFKLRLWATLLISVCGSGLFLSFSGNTQKPATARYADGESVDFALIIEEWKAKHPEIPVFVCVCGQDVCDSSNSWPFRRFKRYQFNLALGQFNALELDEKVGFKCYDIETGTRP
jgi:hypothetical protein